PCCQCFLSACKVRACRCGIRCWLLCVCRTNCHLQEDECNRKQLKCAVNWGRPDIKRQPETFFSLWKPFPLTTALHHSQIITFRNFQPDFLDFICGSMEYVCQLGVELIGFSKNPPPEVVCELPIL